MIALIIHNEDGSVYWKENFNTDEECERWIAEEQTRHYWDKNRTFVKIDNTPTKEQEDKRIADLLAEDAKRKEQLQEIKESKGKVKSLADALAVLEKIIAFLDPEDKK